MLCRDRPCAVAPVPGCSAPVLGRTASQWHSHLLSLSSEAARGGKAAPPPPEARGQRSRGSIGRARCSHLRSGQGSPWQRGTVEDAAIIRRARHTRMHPVASCTTANGPALAARHSPELPSLGPSARVSQSFSSGDEGRSLDSPSHLALEPGIALTHTAGHARRPLHPASAVERVRPSFLVSFDASSASLELRI